MLGTSHIRSKSLSQRRNSAGSCFTAPFITIPLFSSEISHALGGNEISQDEINFLHFFSEFLPVRNCLKKTPADTLSNVIETWTSPLLKTAQKYFDFTIGIVSQHAVDNFFESDMCVSDKTYLVIKINHFRDFTRNLGDAILKLDADYPGLGKWLMKLFFQSPITIGTPADIYEIASYLYWGHEDDEKWRLNDLRDELPKDYTEDDFNQYCEEFLPIRYADFERVFPKWAFDRKERQIDQYTGAMPDIIKSLHELHKKMHLPVFTDVKYLCPDNELPAFVLVWSDGGYDLSSHLINESANMTYQVGYGVSLSPVAMNLKLNREHIDFFTLILNYFEQSIKVLEWLSEGDLS